MKHYSKEFKEEALKLSDEIGVKKAAQQLGVPSRFMRKIVCRLRLNEVSRQ